MRPFAPADSPGVPLEGAEGFSTGAGVVAVVADGGEVCSVGAQPAAVTTRAETIAKHRAAGFFFIAEDAGASRPWNQPGAGLSNGWG